MLTEIPVNEMAETLRVLTGDNARNAARHFGKRSFDSDNVAAAIYWSSIARILETGAIAAAAPSDALDGPPVPQRMKLQVEVTAFRDTWFEDVDADVLIREALEDTLADQKDNVAGEGCGVAERPRALPAEPGGAEDGVRHEAWRLPLAA